MSVNVLFIQRCLLLLRNLVHWSIMIMKKSEILLLVITKNCNLNTKKKNLIKWAFDLSYQWAKPRSRANVFVCLFYSLKASCFAFKQIIFALSTLFQKRNMEFLYVSCLRIKYKKKYVVMWTTYSYSCEWWEPLTGYEEKKTNYIRQNIFVGVNSFFFYIFKMTLLPQR